MLRRPAGVEQEADRVLFAHNRSEVRGPHFLWVGASGLDRRFVHRARAGTPHRLDLGIEGRRDQRYRIWHQLRD